jgi:outer membrane biosynthesis protein TonB
MVSTIGIKIANGEFYSILEENVVAKKRLVLTTVHNNQESVHIDLYKSSTATIQNALYIGRLIVEHIKAKSKGEASIELVISSNENGEIIADALDLDAAGKAQHLQVSLTAPLVEGSATRKNIDFALEHENAPPSALFDTPPAKKKVPLLVLVIIGLVIVILLFLLWFFLLRGKNDESSVLPVPSVPEVVVPPPAPPPPPPAPEEVQQEPAPLTPEVVEPIAEPAPEPAEAEVEDETWSETLKEAEETPVISAPVEAPPPAEPVARTRRNPPVASYKVPTTIPRAGAPYRIRWGDTLWDISEAFYRNPWLYPRIARFNSIRNPDLIISGRVIRIPPRN